MEKAKTQWLRRVHITQFFYSCLIKDLNQEEILKESLLYEFNADQIKCINYFANHKQEYIEKISKLLKKDWSWDRLPVVLQAIMFTAICEYQCTDIDKPVLIDQALVSCDHYQNEKLKPFLNAILDKILTDRKE